MEEESVRLHLVQALNWETMSKIYFLKTILKINKNYFFRNSYCLWEKVKKGYNVSLERARFQIPNEEFGR